MTEAERPKIGVGVIIHDNAGNIVMGERVGSHGAGTLQCPGGHLEYSESFAETAAREVLEETGLEPMEPHKCAAWSWIPWTQMWAWAGEQAKAEKEGKEVQKNLFLPLVNLWREYPEMKDALVGR
ncbi:unnamed protein product [Alternaria alternata]